jgi:negative regulator of sigma E activity
LVSEGLIRRTREGASKWEPIKILLEGDGNSNKTNTTSKTRLRLTTQVGQIHVATGVLLNLGTNFQHYRPENTAEHQTSSPLTSTSQTGEHHRSDRSLQVKLGNFHRKAPRRSDRCNTPVRPVLARKPQNTKHAYLAPN